MHGCLAVACTALFEQIWRRMYTYVRVGHNHVIISRQSLASHPSSFHETREHDNDPTLSLVDHLPEVPTHLLERRLGNDESTLAPIVTGETGVDVVRLLVL